MNQFNMEFPVLFFKETRDEPIGGFKDEKIFRTTSQELLADKVFDGVHVIDTKGDEYALLNVHKTGWSNRFRGFSLLRKGRGIKIDYDLQFIRAWSLDEFKAFVIDRLDPEDEDPDFLTAIRQEATFHQIITWLS